MKTEKLRAHHERSEEIISAVEYFDGMAKRRKHNAVSSGNDHMYNRFMHKADIALRAKQRMIQLYLKHLQTLNP